MLKVGNISQLNEHQYDENWLIVRKPDEIPAYVKHVPRLSPSPELFRKYRETYHAGEFNQEFFEQVYAPQFLKELAEDEQAIEILDELVAASYEKDIFLACYCEDESMCHRSIIAGVLKGMGAKIETDYGYRTYFYCFQIYQKFNNCRNYGWMQLLSLTDAYKTAKRFCRSNWKRHTQIHLIGLGENEGKWVFVFKPFIPDPEGDITVNGIKGYIPTYCGLDMYPIIVEKMTGECWECCYDNHSKENIFNYFLKYDRFHPASVFTGRKSKGKGYLINGVKEPFPSKNYPVEDTDFIFVTQEAMEYWEMFFLAMDVLKYYGSKFPETEEIVYYFPTSFILDQYIDCLYEEMIETGLCSMAFTITLEEGSRQHYLHFYFNGNGSLLNVSDEEYDLRSGHSAVNWIYTIDRTGTSAGSLNINYHDIKERIDAGSTLDILSPDEFALSADWKMEIE